MSRALIDPTPWGEWHRLYTSGERGTVSRALLVASGSGEGAMALAVAWGMACFWATGRANHLGSSLAIPCHPCLWA
jgi:hypothetical protein